MDHESEKDKNLKSQIKEHQQHIKLTASELGDLWTNYMGDNLFDCVFEHFLEVVEDEEIKEIILFNQRISRRHMQIIGDLFIKEGIPLPAGLGSSDVYKGAPRLYDDTFMLYYIQQMSSAAFGQYTRAFASSTRQDVMDFYRQGIQDIIELSERSIHLLLEKGLMIKPPSIPYPRQVEYIDNESFNDFILGKTRPLMSLEIKYLNVTISTNTLGKSLMISFAQTANSQKLRNYFKRGWELSDKQIKQARQTLENDNIPSPMLMDPYISDSKVPPFSDRLMLYHVLIANQMGIENLGIAISRTLRHDLHMKYTKFVAQIGVNANKGQQIMIENGWFEQPPTAADRNRAVKNPKQ